MPSATPSPADGRRPSPSSGADPGATALLGWLTDPDAPRLCLVTGGAGSGKTALLGWLAGHEPRARRGRTRAARVLVPLAGQSALGVAWTLADRLGVVARTPADLAPALATSEARRAGRTVLLLTDLHAAAEPEAVAELLAGLAEIGRIRLVVEVRTGTRPPRAARTTVVDLEGDGDVPPVPSAPPSPPLPELSDPAAVCAADPLLVTTGYAARAEDHGGLRDAWLRAGQAVCAADGPAGRALVLLTALGDGADPRLRPALAARAGGRAVADALGAAPRRRRPALARTGRGARRHRGGPSAGLLLVGDGTGTVRLVRESDAAPEGRLAHRAGGRITALAPTADGTVLLLDERGRLHTVPGTAPRPPYLERLTDAVSTTLSRHPGTALAAIAGSVVVGDRLGSVHAFGVTGLHQAAAHSGRVTAVTAVESETPFVCSGGADGTVRLWTPGRAPVPEPLAERGAPVVALHAAPAPGGPLVAAAWADGRVELIPAEGGRRRSFRPGPAVRAVAVTATGALVVGTDESLVCLEPR